MCVVATGTTPIRTTDDYDGDNQDPAVRDRDRNGWPEPYGPRASDSLGGGRQLVRLGHERHGSEWPRLARRVRRFSERLREWRDRLADSCLLYTSDAADERSSVDLGGRRI